MNNKLAAIVIAGGGLGLVGSSLVIVIASHGFKVGPLLLAVIGGVVFAAAYKYYKKEESNVGEEVESE